MHIRLLDDRTIRLEFPYSAARVARVKALPGTTWDKESKAWSAPLAALRRIVDAFPGATVERACIDARLALWRRWVRQHNACGVWFAYAPDGATVVPVGEGVSPVFADWTAARSEVLAQFLGDQVEPTRSAPSPPAPFVEPSHGDRLIWTGIQNAARVEDRRAEMAERRWGGVAGQMSLLEE